jgi:hypothetical protein
MAYNVRNRLGHIVERIRPINSDVVLYTRGAHSTQLRATPDQYDHTNSQATHLNLEYEYQDFKITTAHLSLPTIGPTLPQAGDVITWQGSEYVVLTPEQREAPWNYTQTTRISLRVHTLRRT